MRSRLIATAGAALAVFASQIAVAAQPPGQPNVVLVITDDQGYGDLSCHGNPVLKTPNLDKLHAESTRLTGYHVAPTCAPTRSALMSGHYTNRTGCWHTIMGRSLMRADETTLGQVFHDAGYQTGMFGKWHLGDNYPFRPEDRGFTEVVRHGGGGVGQTPDYWDNAYFDDTYFHNGKPEKYEGYCTDVYFREARRFVERSAAEGKPFFAYIATNAPHGPFLCPERYWKPYAGMKGVRQAEAVFFGMIANVDENVGALRQWLDDKGLAENTIFIFTTDNGTATGERIFNDGMRGNKGSPYDGGHRVPFFVHWPAKGWTEGRDVDSLCMAYDILPTFIELCGLKAPDGYRFDGVSLAPLLLGQEKSLPDRVCFTDSQRVRDPIKWRQSATMTGRWRLINGEELYDIQTDPGQKNDIADDHPDVVARLRKAYEAWWADLEPSFREDVRIVVGNPAENPSRLTSHDWLTDADMVPWHHGMIRAAKDRDSSGHWALRVAEPGRYRITLRRWPDEGAVRELKLRDGLAPGAPVPGLEAPRETPGASLPIVAAAIQAGDLERETTISADDSAASFEVELPAGDLDLRAYFTLDDGSKVGAYYAYVEKL